MKTLVLLFVLIHLVHEDDDDDDNGGDDDDDDCLLKDSSCKFTNVNLAVGRSKKWANHNLSIFVSIVSMM